MSGIERKGTTARFSDSVSYGGVVYVVEVPSDLAKDITVQAQDMLASLDKYVYRCIHCLVYGQLICIIPISPLIIP